MTEEQLANAAKLMSESYDRMAVRHEKFVEAVVRHTDMLTHTMEMLSDLEDRIDLRMKTYDARFDYLKTMQESVSAMVPALSEAAVSWNENNDKLDILIKKMDKHFGSEAGLEYDN
jgi:cobalamin biosynthesis protein CbiD